MQWSSGRQAEAEAEAEVEAEAEEAAADFQPESSYF